MHKIFISYRREDSIETTGRIYDWLDSRLAPNSIFMDVDSIPPGMDFRVAIKDTITSVSVMLVIIGSRWLTVREPKGGGPRIDNPNDFVRTEVELAIEHSIPIIPILVQETVMPSPDDLPTSLVSLAYRNAVKVRPNPDFQGDMIRVMKGIESADSEIVFSQQAGKVSEQAKEEPTNPEPDLPPIPEGGRSEYGFYYTRVITRQIDREKDDHIIRKEFAFSTSPTNTHEIVARFYKYKFLAEALQLILTISVDEALIAKTMLVLPIDFDKENTIYGPDYDESFTLGAHTYTVKYKIDCTYKVKLSFLNRYSYRYSVSKFEVSADDYRLLDLYSLWN